MRHHSQSATKMKQKNPRSNAWCCYRCWWCAQGPTRAGPHKASLWLSSVNFWKPSEQITFFEWSPPSVTFLTYFLTCYLAFAFYLIYVLQFFLAFYLIYLRRFLWLRSCGQHSDHKDWCCCRCRCCRCRCCRCCCCCCCCCFVVVVFSVLKEVLFPCQRHKNTVNYRVLGLLLGFVEGAEGWGPQINSNRLNNQVPGLASLPFTS